MTSFSLPVFGEGGVGDTGTAHAEADPHPTLPKTGRDKEHPQSTSRRGE